jgi:hypothetical protein
LLAGLVLLSSASVWAAQNKNAAALADNDEERFVFTGKCATDESYRLVSYRKKVSGLTHSFYDYEGPNGKGTVRSETPPKVMAARVCRRMAEIINANYWE